MSEDAITRYRTQVMGGDSTTSSITLKCVGYVGADLAALAREAALVAARCGESLVRMINVSISWCGFGSGRHDGDPYHASLHRHSLG